METFKKIRELWLPFIVTRADHYAASVCFYLLSSFIPSSLLVIAVTASIPGSMGPVSTGAAVIPPSVSLVLEEFIRYIGSSRSITLLSLAGLAALWSSAKVILAIRKGINAMEHNSVQRGYFHRRLRAMAALLLLLLTVCFLGMMEGLVKTIVNRYLLAFADLFLLVLLLYRLLSNSRRPLCYDALGGSLTSLIWMSSTGLFSVYVNYISNYDRDYGFVGILFLSLLWLKLCIQVLFYGIRLSHLLSRQEYHPFRILRSIFSC